MEPQTDLEYLIDWFARYCNGDWEHGYGVRLVTCDNPGWLLKVTVEETDLEGTVLEFKRTERSVDDWIQTKSDGVTWEAAGGPHNLPQLLSEFRRFASGS
jgi:hypothetical protein